MPRRPKLADELKSKGYKAEVRRVDAGDPSSVAALIADVEKLGSIDVLHYNPAAMRKGRFVGAAACTFVSDLAVNIGGALVASQAVVPLMSARGSGTILLTGGGLALEPKPGVSLSQHRQSRHPCAGA